jgi:hypothetical protein
LLVARSADAAALRLRQEAIAAELVDVDARIEAQLSRSKYVSPTLQDLLAEEIQLEHDEDDVEAGLVKTLKEVKDSECRELVLAEIEAERDRWLAVRQELLQNQPAPPSGMGNRPVFLPLPPDRQAATTRPSRRSSANTSVLVNTPEQVQVSPLLAPASRIGASLCIGCVLYAGIYRCKVGRAC